VVVADIDVDRGRQVAAELGDCAIFVRLDVTSPADWASAIERTVDQFGSLDILVNNAGGTAGRTGPLEHMSFADYNFVLSLNLTGAWLETQAAIAPMRKAGGGSIINISSIVGLVAFPGMGAYSAAKCGLRGLTKTVAIELAEDDIRVNSIHPGFIDTPGSSATRLPETIAETPPLPWSVSAVASSRTAERHSSRRALPGQRRDPLLHGHGDGRRWRRDRWTDGSAGPGVIRCAGAGLNACPTSWAGLEQPSCASDGTLACRAAWTNPPPDDRQFPGRGRRAPGRWRQELSGPATGRSSSHILLASAIRVHRLHRRIAQSPPCAASVGADVLVEQVAFQ
jgi:3alpha(or 20beta)-hydroxysteroid dehydrogenase